MRRREVLTALGASVLAAPSVYAQSSKPLTIVVPYAPGGGGDTVARVVSRGLGEALGRPVVVDNRPGANGSLAVQSVLRAEPDGGTFLLTDSSILSINPLLYKSTKYDPKTDLQPAGLIARGPLFLAVHPSMGVNTLDELIAKVRTAPGSFNYGTPGAGSTHHLCMEYFKHSLGLHILHIPYRGATPAITALVSGEIGMTFAALPSLQGFVQNNRVKLLAVNSLSRYARMPDLPAISEKIPGFDFASNVGLVCARSVPVAAVEAVSSAIVSTVKSAAVSEELLNLGVEPIGVGSKDYARIIDSEGKRIEKAVRTTRLQVE